MPLPVPVYFSPEYVLARHEFDTTRKAQWVHESLVAAPIAGIEVRAPEPLTAAELGEVHDPEYVEAVRSGEPRELAESQGFTWDPALWTMVRASNGGAVAAARAALTGGGAGSLSSGLHHARRRHGAGSCTFNGLALAARAALQAGAGAVLVLDLDAHCGGGTHSLLAEDPRVWHTDVSVDDYDAYEPSERWTLDLVRRADDYLPTVEGRLAELERAAPRFSLCIYNAGMDLHERSGDGALTGITAEVLATRERLVFESCRRRGIAVAFVLAGGYISATLDRAELVALHRLTLAAACG
ncbi:histone deacetylase [Nannocystis punicea]|uniref:Histone deacetylase n=1 Tax=Nannocystis punicea TaxID=2995304 RepID=A0ABY7GXI3_9BACT|nr:histone deacetylase [Nannocystis poenicansa]WAS91692.1 histone deacetylase [Nannocystis poenicansa]